MPVDRGTIDRQLRDIGEGERWWELREFRELPRILHSDERLRALVRGKLLGPRLPRLLPQAAWLVVATSQRLICLKQERFGRKQVDVDLGQVTAIRHQSGIRAYRITLVTLQSQYRIRIPKEEAFRFVGALASLVPRPAMQAPELRTSALSRVPGMATVAALPGVAGIASRVSLLSPPELATREELDRVEATVERLEQDVERLQQQVRFLENLLQERAEETHSLGGHSADP